MQVVLQNAINYSAYVLTRRLGLFQICNFARLSYVLGSLDRCLTLLACIGLTPTIGECANS